jgi:hypothetical protein
MTEHTDLDTTIHEPPMTGSEVDMLLFALDRSRAQFVWKCGDPGAAATSGLVGHLDDEPLGVGSRSSHGRRTPSFGRLASHGGRSEDAARTPCRSAGLRPASAPACAVVRASPAAA